MIKKYGEFDLSESAPGDETDQEVDRAVKAIMPIVMSYCRSADIVDEDPERFFEIFINKLIERLENLDPWEGI